ncbi:MAG: 50S ribosomal protein L18 [Actinomycetota bacterium]
MSTHKTNRSVALRVRRHARVRKKILGSASRPRLAVFRSNKHVYAQVIDDSTGRTLVAASTVEPDLRAKKTGSTIQVASEVGKLVAKRALDKGVSTVVFDRGGFRFHGKVKALADGAREQGLDF